MKKQLLIMTGIILMVSLLSLSNVKAITYDDNNLFGTNFLSLSGNGGGIFINDTNLNPQQDAYTDLGKGGQHPLNFLSLYLSGYLHLRSQGSTQFYTNIIPGYQSSTIIYVLPTTQGARGTALMNDGNGVLYWGYCGCNQPTSLSR